MRVKGIVNGCSINILIDSGSTHNILDMTMPKKLGCAISLMPPQAVTMADGNHIACQHKCDTFSWAMQGKLFTTDVMLIPLGSCDMVLGVQWLATLGSICLDFKKLLMEFTVGGVTYRLGGVSPKKSASNGGRTFC